MATNLWGKVYYQNTFAGILSQEAGGRCVFQYDESYIMGKNPAIAFTLPLQQAAFVHEDGLHPFFDNLVAEGWLRDAQARAIGVRKSNRFALLLSFGVDCIGAISIIDPDPTYQINVDLNDPKDMAALATRASLSGIQPKLGVVKEGNLFRACHAGELSTHIAKLPSGNITDIIENEYITTVAYRQLLKNDAVVEMVIAPINDVTEKALIITRFDRTITGQKIHFEEFNQLLGKNSEDKYQANYEDMADFIQSNSVCLKAEHEKLYRRILACILIGNTDAHLKNFALFHLPEGLRLTPAYDIVASALYPEYQVLGLGLNDAHKLRINAIKPQALIRLGAAFGLPHQAIKLAIDDFQKQLKPAKEMIMAAKVINLKLKNNLIELMEKRWNGTFALTGQQLSNKP